MPIQIERTGTKVLTLVTVGLALACSNEAPTPTGLPMPRTSSANERGLIVSPHLNSPPRIDRVVLRPESPSPGGRITALVEASDAEHDAIQFEFVWTIDGVNVENSGSELILKNVSKGSWVKVAVVARDPGGESEPTVKQVTVANQPPVVLGVVLEPLGEVSIEHDVTADARSYDPDGDDVTYQYVWKINGFRDETNGAVLPASRFKRGDEIVLQVVANDGEDLSDPLISDPIPVVNAKPRIVSTPSGFGGESFSYVLRVEDPDGDRALRFRLAKGPNGMTIDNMSGEINWVPRSNQQGAYTVEVTVEDGQGGKDAQRFELTLGFDAADAPAAVDR